MNNDDVICQRDCGNLLKIMSTCYRLTLMTTILFRRLPRECVRPRHRVFRRRSQRREGLQPRPTAFMRLRSQLASKGPDKIAARKSE